MNKEEKRYKEKLDKIRFDLKELLNKNPKQAIVEARKINVADKKFPYDFKLNLIKGGILVNAGGIVKDINSIKEGVQIFKWCHEKNPTSNTAYNLANGMSAMIGKAPHDEDWLNHQEKTRHDRHEIRRHYWSATKDEDITHIQKSMSLTNLGNQFSGSFRYGDAQDAWFFALEADMGNSVAACRAAQELLYLYEYGIGSYDNIEQIKILSRMIRLHKRNINKYTNQNNSEDILAFANQWDEPLFKPLTEDPFIKWVKYERLALALVLDSTNPTLETLDWLDLDPIEGPTSEGMPIIFSMFNMLKSDYILARDLTWRALDRKNWEEIGVFADTCDGALYGADISALILAHRSVLDILEKVAVLANEYFGIGENTKNVSFSNLWRVSKAINGERPLKDKVKEIINSGVYALYGLVELSGDYNADIGIFNDHKNIRNASTHRFVILHEYLFHKQESPFGDIKKYEIEHFQKGVMQALRIVRSALQVLVLAIRQNEEIFSRNSEGTILDIEVPDFRRE